MRIAIMQPTYLPWMGYFDLIDRVDQFVLLDDVDFASRSWQQRNRIKNAQGEQMLSLPVKKKGQAGKRIDQTLLNNNDKWAKKHRQAISLAYGKSAFFREISEPLFPLYADTQENLADFNIAIIKVVSSCLGLETPLLRSSTLKCEGKKVDHLLAICRHLGANEYLSPVGSFDYIDEDNRFTENGIQLWYQHFEHPQYSQRFGEFIPYLSIIDLLFNEGPNALRILRSGQRPLYSHEDVKNQKGS
jgi:hypothetical protein